MYTHIPNISLIPKLYEANLTCTNMFCSCTCINGYHNVVLDSWFALINNCCHVTCTLITIPWMKRLIHPSVSVCVCVCVCVPAVCSSVRFCFSLKSCINHIWPVTTCPYYSIIPLFIMLSFISIHYAFHTWIVVCYAAMCGSHLQMLSVWCILGAASSIIWLLFGEHQIL